MAVISVRIPNRRAPLPRKPRGRALGQRESSRQRSPARRSQRLLLACAALGVLLATLAHLFLRHPLTIAMTEALPATWVKSAAINTQHTLDQTQLRPSQASGTRIEALTTRFAALSAPASGALPYRLIFRRGGLSGPLTYALPDGSIVVTDELLATLPDDTQVLALLCHELGHLHHRHMLQASIEDQVFTLALASLLGLEKVVVQGLETGILNAEMGDTPHYEADRFAQHMLAQNGLSPRTLHAALETLARQASTTRAQSPLLRAPSAELFQSRIRYLPQRKG
ncbi:MAG: hypothetical protein RJA63_273 [Pseudomonadota bacterium]|jgi:Zn-dependent protease with chaperone function